jgi:hypothetical protein
VGLRVFVNRVPRGIFEAKRENLTGSSRKLHRDELHNCSFHEKIAQ